MRIPQPLLLDDADDQEPPGRQLQLVLQPAEQQGQQVFQLFSRDIAEQQTWTLHAEGQLEPAAVGDTPHDVPEPLEALRARLHEESVAVFYEQLAAAGIGYGASFQGLVGLWSGRGQSLGEDCLATPHAPDE